MNKYENSVSHSCTICIRQGSVILLSGCIVNHSFFLPLQKTDKMSQEIRKVQIRYILFIALLLLSVVSGNPAMADQMESRRTDQETDCQADQKLPLPSQAVPVTEIYIRSKPSPEAEAVGIAHTFDTITIIEETDSSWVKVLFTKDGERKVGYLNGVFLGGRSSLEGTADEKEIPEKKDTGDDNPEENVTEQEIPETDLEALTAGDDRMILPDLESMQPGDILWIGDSRTEGMSWYEKNDQYLAEESIGIRWMEEDGQALLMYVLDKSGEYPVVFGFGINDIAEPARFVEMYRHLIAYDGKGRIWLMSVNPVDEYQESCNGYQVLNREVEAFNSVLREAFPDEYIDMYGYLMEQGYASTDGIHFTEATYCSINRHMHEMLENARSGDAAAEKNRTAAEEGKKKTGCSGRLRDNEAAE